MSGKWKVHEYRYEFETKRLAKLVRHQDPFKGSLSQSACDACSGSLMRVDRSVKVIDGELVFPPCPPGCDGVGSSIHTAHRLRELGKPVPRYLDVQIAFRLEWATYDVIRMSAVLREKPRASRVLEPKIEAGKARVRVLRAWLFRSPDPCGTVGA